MKFTDLVDIGELRALYESYSAHTGLGTAILDPEGNILVSTGWHEICTRFHRAHPRTAIRCIESDTVLAGQLKRGEKYNIYRCKNGLVDVAVPIYIGGEHVANFFTGQFFLEPPDRDYFIRQAEEFGFDKKAYMEVLERVPVYTEERIKPIIEFFSRLARLMGEMGLTRKRLEEANVEMLKQHQHLEETVKERTAELSELNLQLKKEIADRQRGEEYSKKLGLLKQQLLGTYSLEEKLKLITDNVVAIFEADFARIWMIREADLCDRGCPHAAVTEGPGVCRYRDRCLHLMASSGRYTSIAGVHRRVPMGCYKIGRIATGEELYFVTNNVTSDPRVHDREWARSLGLVAFAGFRLVSPDGRPVGVLALFSKKAITQDEINYLKDMASTTSQVIQGGLAEKLLHERTEELNRFFMVSLDLLCIADIDGHFLRLNQEWEQVLGYPLRELEGKRFIDLVHPDDLAATLESIKELASGREVLDFKNRSRCKEGTYRWIEWRSRPYGERRIYAAARDITERKRAEEALADAKAQAELYVDLMSHDINNLNQVGIGYLNVALETLDLAEEEQYLISRPLEALDKSTRLINNVRKLRLASEGGFSLYRVEVGEVIRELIPQYTEIADRNITINFTGCECFVMANDLLSDVFSNIIGNAIKHSSGPVTVDIGIKTAPVEGREFCVVSIEDHGPGIPDDLKKKLFTRFQRGATKASGMGLGLYLVRTLVEDYHGKVWVEDRVSGDFRKGSKFVVMLPGAD